MLHVAIIKREYAGKILAGEKTVESRLSVNRVPPFGMVERGDEILFRVSGGGYVARGLAGEVVTREGLTPRAVRGLARRYGRAACGPAAYWAGKSSARYATLIELEGVEAIEDGPALPPMFGRGWAVLGSAEPLPMRRRSA